MKTFEKAKSILRAENDDFWSLSNAVMRLGALFSRQLKLEPNGIRRRKSDWTLSENIMQQYTYHRLPDSRSIRLVLPVGYDGVCCTIFAVLKTCNLDDCCPYTALSYTWGPAARARSEGINQKPLFRWTLAIIEQSEWDKNVLLMLSKRLNSLDTSWGLAFILYLSVKIFQISLSLS